ncbi:Phosphotransferase enzyme family [Aspergillus sclerotialis]|uniref:Phosphotransferase enzyme family n=1 Tax=Aspergillus sclerotialis TaxID=2070753 RepID=A0A3A2ZVT5_9EURO|nr:Phosphotransferase enzyme family [Aspergillus sclerotialis]
MLHATSFVSQAPLPEVLAFSDTCDNELNCPFILIDYIEGRPLYDVWLDKESPKHVVRSRRVRALQDIAIAMVQLDKFSFDKAGSLIFNDQNSPTDVGPMRFVGTPAMLDRSQCEDPDESTIYLETGPFSDPKEYYRVILDQRGEQSSSFESGLLSFLRLAISWIPEPVPTKKNQKPFVLAHPDMDIQNFLVNDEGALQAIIDWDGVGDWDPAMYGWNEDMERGIEPVGVWEDLPETLKFYRGGYAGFIASGAEAHSSLTRNSVVYENLHIAASEPLCTHPILEKIFDEIVRILRNDEILAEYENGRGDLHDEDESRLEEFDIFNVC